jgi:chromate transport protein ChrA
MSRPSAGSLLAEAANVTKTSQKLSVLGRVLIGLGLLGVIGIVVSAVVGINADSQEAAGLAKLACVLCMGASGVFLVPGVILLAIGIVGRTLSKRQSRQSMAIDDIYG